MKRTRLKYYLRALGIGIIVATLLTGYSRRGQAQMTDEEILQRAAALGMTERQGTLLADIANAAPQPTAEPPAMPTEEPTAAPMVEPTAAPTVEPTTATTTEPNATPTEEPTTTPMVEPTAAPTEEPATTPMAEPTTAPTAEPTTAPTTEPTATPMVEPTTEPTAEPTAAPTDAPTGDTVTLVIRRGESSITVSKSLQELGLVEDYKDYDKFLCDGGYDHYISAGIYEIPINSSYEEIVRIISKKQ